MNEPLRTNFHTHTARCQHADGSEEDYVRAAIDSGFSVLGFADHAPWAFADGFVSPVRMLPRQLPEYVNTVRALAATYADRIHILCGLECEYYPTLLPWLREQAEQYALDYLILGCHFAEPESDRLYFGSVRTEAGVEQYARAAIAGLETGLFSCLAHPDVSLQFIPAWTPRIENALRALARTAKALDIPVEYNLLGHIYGRRPDRAGCLTYPYPRFWELAAEEGCTAIVGVDAHTSAHMTQAAEYDAAVAYLKGLGMPLVYTLRGAK